MADRDLALGPFRSGAAGGTIGAASPMLVRRFAPGGRAVSAEENKATDRRLVEEALDRGNLAVADELIAPDFVDHAAPPGMEHGPDGFKAAVAAYRAAFPDLQAAVEEQVAEGDRVAVRLTARGTHTGPLMGLPPTGKEVSFAGMKLFRIAEGKIVESWGQFDALGLLRQLGAVPAPGQFGARRRHPTVRSPSGGKSRS